MKAKLAVIICFFSFSATVAHGHLLWASYTECIAKLGEPECEPSDVPPATDACSWRKGAWGTMIHFWDRRAHWISSVKLDGSGVSDTEFQATLNAFADGNSWVNVGGDEYRRSDRRVSAKRKANAIQIYTETFMTAAALRVH